MQSTVYICGDFFNTSSSTEHTMRWLRGCHSVNMSAVPQPRAQQVETSSITANGHARLLVQPIVLAAFHRIGEKDAELTTT